MRPILKVGELWFAFRPFYYFEWGIDTTFKGSLLLQFRSNRYGWIEIEELTMHRSQNSSHQSHHRVYHRNIWVNVYSITEQNRLAPQHHSDSYNCTSSGQYNLQCSAVLKDECFHPTGAL